MAIASTIKDIARAARVSPSTVSKALNHKADVSAKTRKRIQEIAKKFNFTPNFSGKNLKRQVTENIGVIFCREFQPLSGNPFYSRVLEGIEGECAINNYNLMLHLLPANAQKELPRIIREQRVDGVILVGVFDEDFTDIIKNLEFNTVLLDPKTQIQEFCQILIDNEQGAFQATEYLIKQGHEKIGFISGDLERLSFYQRFEGYRKALQHHEILFDKHLIQCGGLEQGYEHVKKLLKIPKPPTAIFAANDINALYGYKAIREAGLKIPEDVSIIGFDDIALANLSSPPLTTMRVYKEEMGSIAVRYLIQLIKKELHHSIKTIVPTKLVERNSVSCVNKTHNSFN